MAESLPSPTAQLRWVHAQIAQREYWLREGLRGGHSDETLARCRTDLVMLQAIADTLEGWQLSLFPSARP
jgi:hypothetical protein